MTLIPGCAAAALLPCQVRAECAGPSGRYEREVVAGTGGGSPPRRASAPGELPCLMFPHDCGCASIGTAKIFRAIAVSH
eukprot:COSAG01_NODE_5390_length_4291_cov_3.107109_2_plen_79_part_00